MAGLDPAAHRETDPSRRLIVALDVESEDRALRCADLLRPELVYAKVGLQLFTASGPPVVHKLVSLGLRVFLDLKLHDIPNTVAGAMRSITRLGVTFTTVHAAAGAAVAAAVDAAAQTRSEGPHPGPTCVLAVTVLTSHDEAELPVLYGTQDTIPGLVLRLGRAAVAAGAGGLVCSPREIAALRADLGSGPLLVVPGIRPAGTARDDQSRVATPTTALQAGADFLVVGRPILNDPAPRDALRRVLDEMERAM